MSQLDISYRHINLIADVSWAFVFFFNIFY